MKQSYLGFLNFNGALIWVKRNLKLTKGKELTNLNTEHSRIRKFTPKIDSLIGCFLFFDVCIHVRPVREPIFHRDYLLGVAEGW